MSNQPTYMHNPIISKGAAQENELLEKLFTILFKVINEIPSSAEKRSSDGVLRARKLTAEASLRAAAISGALALPTGPLGWLTILPDLAAIWRLQAQLVADIGAVFGKRGKLTEESIIYCLFRHAAAQAVRDLVTRMGERLVLQCVSVRVAENVLRRIGVKVVHRVARRGLWRLLPAIGALAVAGYAYYDTEQVGQTAIEFFTQDIELK
ncbi:MAG TPA: EcsC family protein [Candidatus Binatia bacterium]